MKKLLFFLFAAFLLAACNNNGGNGMGGGGWSTQDKNQFLEPCVNGGQTKEICSCVLQKLEKQYANLNEANTKGGEAAGRQLALECMNGGGGNVNNDNNNGAGNLGGGNLGGGTNGGGWTKSQHQQYVQGCESTAQQSQGFTAEQAHEYCECMTTKVEQKYSFAEAGRLTAADFQTEEWQTAAEGCRPRN